MKNTINLIFIAVTLILLLWVTDTTYVIRHEPVLAVIHAIIYSVMVLLLIISIKKDFENDN